MSAPRSISRPQPTTNSTNVTRTAAELSQVLTNLALVSEQAKRSVSTAQGDRGSSGVRGVGGGGGAGGRSPAPELPGHSSSWVPGGGGVGGGGHHVPAAKLQQYKQQLHLLQDTLLQSAQSEDAVGWSSAWGGWIMHYRRGGMHSDVLHRMRSCFGSTGPDLVWARDRIFILKLPQRA